MVTLHGSPQVVQHGVAGLITVEREWAGQGSNLRPWD